MVVIQQDSELMVNYIAANPIPAGTTFKVFQDTLREPAAFSLGTDGHLHLLIEVEGQAKMTDFGKSAGITAEIQAFDVQQAPDLSLDICLATKDTEKTSDFWLLHNIKVDELLKTIPDSKISKGNFPFVHNVFMSNLHTDKIKDYPLIMVAFKPSDRLGSTEDLSFVDFTHPQKPQLQTQWSLATNPKRILDIAFGTTPMGDGVCVLYEAASAEGSPSKTKVQFRVFRALPGDENAEAHIKYSVEPPCPTGVVCLSSFIQPNDDDPSEQWSTFILAGDDIHQFSGTSIIRKTGKSKLVATCESIVGSTSKDKPLRIKDIHVTQPVSEKQDEMHMWYTTDDDAVHYYTTKASDVTTGTIIPLLPAGQGGQTSAMLAVRAEVGQSKGTIVNSILSVDENEHITLLQQDPNTRVWQQYPWYHIPADEVLECIPVQSYLLRMRAVAETADDSKLVPGCWLNVRSSGLVRCLVNGQHSVLTTEPQWLQTDAKGVLNIMLQTTDATCHTFAADSIRPAESTSDSAQKKLSGGILDPSRKVLSKVAAIKSASDIKACKKPNGEALFKDVSEKDAATAVESFQNMSKYMSENLHQNDVSGVAAFDVLSTGQTPPRVGDWLGDTWNEVWHFVEHSVEHVVEWGVHIIEEGSKKVWQFILKLGDSAIEFTLDCVAAVCKAVNFVLKKLGAAIQDIVDFLGFFFSWNDVLETADSLAAAFDVTLTYGGTLLDTIDKHIDTGLETLQKNIQDNLESMKSKKYQCSKQTLREQQEKPKNDADQNKNTEHKDSVAFNWGSMQFNNGGGKAGTVDAEKAVPQNTVDILSSLWDDVIAELGTLQDLIFTPLMHSFIDILSGEFDLNHILDIVSQDVVTNFITALKKLKSIVVKAVELGISLVRDIANAEINIPVLSWLWKTVIAGGRKLTILNLCALLVAIPTTVLYKTVKKAKCPALKNRLTVETFKQYVDGDKTVGDEGLKDDLELFTLAAVSGLTVVAADFEALSIVTEGVVKGLNVEKFAKWAMDSVGSAVDSILLVFSVIELFTDWPIANIESTPDSLESWCRWAIYSLKLAKPAGLVIVKSVGKKKNVDKSILNKWRGAIAAAVSVPTLAIGLVENIHKTTGHEESPYKLSRGYLKDTLEFGEQWGYAVATWNDEAENEIMYVALAVKIGCALANADVGVLDFIDT